MNWRLWIDPRTLDPLGFYGTSFMMQEVKIGGADRAQSCKASGAAKRDLKRIRARDLYFSRGVS